jgi:uncharacterized protein YbjT (DUF2867 family)
VARALLKVGHRVRALVRDPASDGARTLSGLGADLHCGSFEAEASLTDAARGANAVFSVQLFNPSSPHSERRQASALIAAAKSAGVTTFIQSSVSGVGAHATATGWGEGRWDRDYWESKADIEDAARTAGFASTVVLRPAFMMENFIAPKATRMFPNLSHGVLRTALGPRTQLALVAADDIGAAVSLALQEPARFTSLELAGDVRTMSEVAVALSDAWLGHIRAESRTPEELVAAGQSPGWVRTQEWLNEVGYPARPQDMSRVGLQPTTLATWAEEHKP